MIAPVPANSTMTLDAPDTIAQYDAVISRCRELFLKKTTDYGTSWRVLRPISITDQVYIKAWRIRQIQETGKQLISDSIESEFIGIVNYGIIALIQQEAKTDDEIEWTTDQARIAYDAQSKMVRDLMQMKNNDYGEAWRQMSQESFTDLILTKLLRIRQIIANEGQTIVSEGMDSNFTDIINYAVFALIKISEAP